MSIHIGSEPITAEEERDVMRIYKFRMYPDNMEYYTWVNKLKHEYKLITFFDVEMDYVILLLVPITLSWEEMVFNIRGFVHNDARQTKTIYGFIYCDVQGAYNKKRIHSRVFSVYFGHWRSVFFNLFPKCFRFFYGEFAPSKIMASTDVYRILEAFTVRPEPFPERKYIFYYRNDCNFIEPDLTQEDQDYFYANKYDFVKLPEGERIIPLPSIEFSVSKITRKRPRVTEENMRMPENATPKPIQVNPAFNEITSLEKHMVEERCIRDNPLRTLCKEGWGGEKSYKEELDELIKKNYGSYDDFYPEVKKQYRLITLVDKLKDFVVNILYDNMAHKLFLPQLLYQYADGCKAPITVYIHFDPDLPKAEASSFYFDVFYDKWAYFFKRLYPTSYAIPAYVYKNKYFNYNFLFIEFGYLLQCNSDKTKISYCYFEQREDGVVQELDDKTTYNPNPMPSN